MAILDSNGSRQDQNGMPHPSPARVRLFRVSAATSPGRNRPPVGPGAGSRLCPVCKEGGKRAACPLTLRRDSARPDSNRPFVCLPLGQNTNLKPNCMRRIGTVTGFTLVEPASALIVPAFGAVTLLTGGPRFV